MFTGFFINFLMFADTFLGNVKKSINKYIFSNVRMQYKYWRQSNKKKFPKKVLKEAIYFKSIFFCLGYLNKMTGTQKCTQFNLYTQF